MSNIRVQSEIDVKDIIEAVGASGKRSRSLFLTIVIATVLAFSAVWKSFPIAWMNARSVRAQYAVEYVSKAVQYVARNQTKDKDLKYVFLQSFPEVEELLQKNDGKSLEASSKEERKRLTSGKETAELRDLRDIESAIEYRRNVDKVRYENVLLVRIPVFGVTFDVNDAGLLSGITYVILFLLLRMALIRESDNFGLLFRVTESLPSSKLAYWYLTMSQVVTVAPISSKTKVDPFWRFLPKVLLWIPFCFQLLIFCYDIWTYNRGMAVSKEMYLIDMLVCFASLVAVGILTWQSCGALIAIDYTMRKLLKHAESNGCSKEATVEPDLVTKCDCDVD